MARGFQERELNNFKFNSGCVWNFRLDFDDDGTGDVVACARWQFMFKPRTTGFVPPVGLLVGRIRYALLACGASFHMPKGFVKALFSFRAIQQVVPMGKPAIAP